MPPSYRKVNPADAPVLLLALTSPSLTLPELQDYAEHLISPTLSTLDRRGAGQHLRRQALRGAGAGQPEALAARNITLDELRAALRRPTRTRRWARWTVRARR